MILTFITAILCFAAAIIMLTPYFRRLAVCGCDTDKLIEGTVRERERFLAQGVLHPACRYATLRNYFLSKGKVSELFVSYDPFLRSYGEWWKQLFGESEGKQNKGIYPTSAVPGYVNRIGTILIVLYYIFMLFMTRMKSKRKKRDKS